MKKSLLALALFTFVGTAAFAHDGDGKPSKNKKATACSAAAASHCSGGMGATAGTPSCCMKKGMKTAATTTPAVTPAAKSL